MIPKIIHYCWFGGNKYPKLVKKCILSWKKRLPDFQIKCWNEDTFNLAHAPQYVKEAYQKQKYAFVSDYVRLYALYHEGGVYLDTDVEVCKDFTNLLNSDVVMGYENKVQISTAFIASVPQSVLIKKLLDSYYVRHFIREDASLDMTTNVSYISAFLRAHGIELNGEYIKSSDLELYPQEYFSPRSWEDGKYHITGNTYAIHYFQGSWHSPFTKFLSIFCSNYRVYQIAGYKEKIIKLIRRR